MEELDVISEILEKAYKWGLQTEVVDSSLQEMKTNPELTPSQAIVRGAIEWDII